MKYWLIVFSILPRGNKVGKRVSFDLRINKLRETLSRTLFIARLSKQSGFFCETRMVEFFLSGF